jgi:hypothetical protein
MVKWSMVTHAFWSQGGSLHDRGVTENSGHVLVVGQMDLTGVLGNGRKQLWGDNMISRMTPE